MESGENRKKEHLWWEQDVWFNVWCVCLIGVSITCFSSSVTVPPSSGSQPPLFPPRGQFSFNGSVYTQTHQLPSFNLIMDFLLLLLLILPQWFYSLTRSYEAITNLETKKPFINSKWSFWRCTLSPPPLKNRNTCG